MNRPLVITLIGWLGIIAGLLQLGTLGYLMFSDKQGPVMPDNLGMARIAFSLLGVVASFSLLCGQRWARIYLTVSMLVSAVSLWVFPGQLLAVYSAAYVQAIALLSSGIMLFLLCLLYSPAANLFFRPRKDPVPFNHYDTVRQFVLLLAFAAIGYGGYASWDIAKRGETAPPKIDPNAPRPIRTFTNTNGATMQARLIYFDGAQVIIERADGTRFNNPIGLYSAADQAYIRKESGR